MTTTRSREIHLAARPRGWPTFDTFSIVEVAVPPPADGQVLVRNLFMSVDPYMRGRMNAAKSYVAPFEVGAVLSGEAIGRVELSRAAGIEEGAIVSSMQGWREAFTAEAKDVRTLDPSVQPLSAYLGVLGMPGLTAWVGLDLAAVAKGDRVLVSGAAGAVGHVAGQLARHRGCFVAGSAGAPEKVRMLVDELGFDAAFNYKDGDLTAQVKTAAPDGLDVYFDNVGGDHLEAALWHMRPHGRIAACGSISRYNDESLQPGPRNLFLVVTRRLTIRGFIVTDSFNRMGEFRREVTPQLASGALKGLETIVDGIEHAPQAFLDMLKGGNIGKMVVKL